MKRNVPGNRTELVIIRCGTCQKGRIAAVECDETGALWTRLWFRFPAMNDQSGLAFWEDTREPNEPLPKWLGSETSVPGIAPVVTCPDHGDAELSAIDLPTTATQAKHKGKPTWLVVRPQRP